MGKGNDLQKTKLYEKLISKENIFLSIYSLESYVFNKELLDDNDELLMNELKDKFNEVYINNVIEKVQECLKELVVNPEYFVEAKVYFNPKKYQDKEVIFRPLHVSDIISQIALVSIMNLFIYEFNEGNEKITLSNISRLIPSNFYGNRVSIKPEILFKPWKTQYKAYTKKANELFKTFHTTREYKYEIDLDLENFFPSVDPEMLYNLMLSLIPIIIDKKELELYKVLLIKLLVCKISNLDSHTSQIYYGSIPESEQIPFGLGIPQGLPQSYFLGNICMIEISKIFEKYFQGKSLYYVDDSVIFSNDIKDSEDFRDKLKKINEDIQKFIRQYKEEKNDSFFRMYNEELITFIRNREFSIRVHDVSGKSTYTEIGKAKEGEIYLKSLSRAASQIGFDLYTTYSDEEDDNLNAKIEILLKAICQEKEELDKTIESVEDSTEKESLETYRTKLTRYYKFFKYRKLKLDVQRNDEDISINDESIAIPVESKDFLEKFLDIYKQDVWGAYIALCINSARTEENLGKISKYIEEVNQKVFGGYNNKESSYIYTSFKRISENKKVINIDPYKTIGELANEKLGRYMFAHRDVVNKVIEKEIRKYQWETLLEETGMFSHNYLETVSIVDNSTAEMKRMVLNALYSRLFSVQLNDDLFITRQVKRALSYGELRILAYLRNSWFSKEIYKVYSINLLDEDNVSKIDYSIMEVLEIFRTFIKYPILIDNLILVHQYTCDVWKNGSKYLYFYTLHNQEHAIDLIKNVIKVIKAVDYLQISMNDYYIVFISCYLHDISMVKIPSMDEFLMDSTIADQISRNYLDEIKDRCLIDNREIKQLLIKFYKEIDVFFENRIRSNHAKESADEIRTRNDLYFLDDCLREKVAEISLAHGQRVEDVYNIKSDAKNSLVSTKFDKILLRIADLLDMSSYRVSKPILNHNIEQMSSISAFHWISHLLTKGYKLETKYRIIDEGKSALLSGQIEEKIILHIDICMSQLSKITNDKLCKFGKMDETSVSSKGFTLKCGEKCNGEKCNFLCKWFVKKNEYLMMEFEALKAYLNRIPTKFYTSDFEICLHIVDKTNLDAQQFEILKSNLL